ncbi:AT-rich interactive domain-containing protein 2 [Andrographis paniculata]|uniref:AT-rich interactive domain-containing protein 2 n=1 Tax=Andrographis paniculata TaxID=175694 RepID=UPI0021E8D226|nr:AT-rich interactive domain-containing protein 2 [Andrographis paniculata]XP_051119017.1 AT-rich interactive domain-containing protein 2 [Andrographis paniculata]
MEECRKLNDNGGYGEEESGFGFGLDADFKIERCRFDACKERLRSCFDHVLTAFTRQKSAGKCIRPIPALCGDGRPVDLFKLFWIVRKVGGHGSVSRNNLWGIVSEECGLGFAMRSFVKLVYMKYLKELDQWLQRVFDTSILEDELIGVVHTLDMLYWELENGIGGLLMAEQGNGSEFSECATNTIPDIIELSSDGGICKSKNEKSCNVLDKNDVRVLAEEAAVEFNSKASEERLSDIGNVLGSRKRKQQSRSFPRMLEWLTHIAKHSDDPSIGFVPESSKWTDYRSEELWKQTLAVRGALLIRRHHNANAGQSSIMDQPKKPRMHPSMYEDNVCNSQIKEKQRYSTRITSSTIRLCGCCNSQSPHQSKSDICQEKKIENDIKAPVNPVVTETKEPAASFNDHESLDVVAEKQVSIGPLFQAEIPEWTDEHSESDPKWLGRKTWQAEEDNSSSLDLIGKGRSHHPCCSCSVPNSVNCVRFHIAEKRLKLKQELGPLFHRWGFNRMGEEVSLSWTEDEENAFKDMMKSISPLHNKFFNKAFRYLPSKTKRELVSYYFNVYVVQRRSYQNRVTPKDIDSDDDEKECGSIGGRFGYQALYIPGSGSISCSLNKQSSDFR